MMDEVKGRQLDFFPYIEFRRARVAKEYGFDIRLQRKVKYMAFCAIQYMECKCLGVKIDL